jgi:hypothetical protein
MYTILLSVLLVGEALALWVGMRSSNPGGQDWNWKKNSVFIYLDAVCGILLFLELVLKMPEIIFWIVFSVVVLSHAFREYEYLSLRDQPFCINLPLFIVNNLKIILSMSTAVIHLTLV